MTDFELKYHIGDRVFVTADNYGSPAEIIETRASDGSPASHYQVRTDTGDQFWAFDFEIGEPMPYDSTEDTKEHIAKVQARIQECVNKLIWRASDHDRSKLREPEKAGYDILVGALAGSQYGTDAFRVAMKEANADPVVKEAIQHHYAENTHHPEHYQNGIEGMSLLDVLEMACDWKGASERYGPSALALDYNIKRWNISPQLAAILENTVKELGW